MNFNVDVIVKTIGSDKIDELERQINRLKSQTVTVNVQTNNSNFQQSLNNITKQANTAGKQIGSSIANGTVKQTANVGQQIGSNITKSIDQVQKNLQTKKYDAKLSTFQHMLDPYLGSSNTLVKQAQDQIDIYDDAFTKLQRNFDATDAFSLTDNEIIDQMNRLNDAGQTFSNTMTQVRNTMSKQLRAGVAERSALNVESYMKANSKALKKYGVELQDLAKKYRTATTEAEKLQYDNDFKNYQAQIKAEGLTGKSFSSELGRGFKQIGQFAMTYGVIERIPETISRMYQEVTKVDSAMTELYKVTDETSETYATFQANAGTTAKSLGRDISSYIEQTAEWTKLGYSMQESAELSKISSMYANVGDVDDATAVSDMVTAMKAYNIEASDAMSIADSYNELGNKFATDAASIGEGISNSASSLAAAGNDFNQSVAMITGMTEITQEAGEAGNALKILAMRVRGYDEETESYSNDVEELNGKVADLTKTAETPGGISLFTDETKETYKSTYELMEEISTIYDDLSDRKQAELLEVLAGKNRGNQIAALIQSFQSGQVQSAYEASVNAAGSAMTEQERWLDSIQAKQQQLSAAFQEFSTTAINSDFAKGLLDFGTDSLEVITQLIDSFGVLNTLVSGLGIVQGIKGGG